MTPRLERSANGRAAVVVANPKIGPVLAVLALICAALLVYELVWGRGPTERVQGLIGGGITMALGAMLAFERVRLEIDLASRTVRWRRRSTFRVRERTFRIDDIVTVSADLMPMHRRRGYPKRRVVVHLRDGTELPLESGYQPDVDDRVLKMAASVRDALGLETAAAMPATVEARAAALVAKGDAVTAVKLLRAELGLSMEDAVWWTRQARIPDR